MTLSVLSVLSEEKIHDVCKIGQGALCCKYLLVSSDGFHCGKNSEFRNILQNRTNMVAKGDNCEGVY